MASRVAPFVKLGVHSGEFSWDYVFVMPPDDQVEKLKECRKAINRMKKVGLAVKAMKGSHGETMVLVSANQDRLETEAEFRKLDMKLKPEFYDKKTGSAAYADFSKAEKNRFAGHDDTNFFTSLERQKLLLYIFEAPKSEDGCELNIDQLRKSFTAITPLHESDARESLMRNWVKGCHWKQPLDDVRDYFGEKIAMYFSFLGHYTHWLVYLSVFGLITQCVQWANHDADSPLVPFYCLFLMLWTTFFLESWKRQQVTNAFLWNVQDFEEEETIRPEFTGSDVRGVWRDGHFLSEQELADEPELKFDDITETKYFPTYKRILRFLFSVPVVSTFVLSTFIGTTGILVFRAAISLPYPNGMGQTGQILGGLTNAFFINVMNMVYKVVAVKLNDFENYRTDTEYEDSLIIKVFVFQFVNSYISLFYIAFIKQFQVTLFGMKSGTCRNSCMDEMASQLLSLVVLMQIVGNIKELLVPYMVAKVKVHLAKRKARKSGVTVPQQDRITKYEEESQMPVYESTFDDYDEMAIQFGFVTMFAAAFPFASFASLLNNIVEIRSDAFKLLRQTQRPKYAGCEDIGSWQKVFETISTISVLTNVCIIGFTSLVLAGKCEFASNFPVGCTGTGCAYFAGDAFRAPEDNSVLRLGSITFDIDCHNDTDAGFLHDSCCPSIFQDGINIVRPVKSTLFLSQFHVMIMVVVCEHLMLFLRAVLAEVIPDVPTWVLKAQARLDFKKEHSAEGNKNRAPKVVAQWNDSEDTEEVTLQFIQPTELEFATD